MNIEFNKVTWYSKLLAFLVVVAIFVFAFLLGRKYEETVSVSAHEYVSPDQVVEPLSIPAIPKKTETSPEVAQNFLHFFVPVQPLNSMGGVDNSSNVIGYFAGGNFYWYVPMWLVGNEKWESENTSGGGMTFSPNEAFGPVDFSPIVISVATTTESYNAETLYSIENPSSSSVSACFPGSRCEVTGTNPGVVTNEIIISKVGESRIYHVARKLPSGMIQDKFFIDGNNRTVSITFSAPATTYTLYEAKIREMVQGMGRGGVEQG